MGRDGTAVRVAGGARRGIRADLRDAPDLAPIVAAMACRAEGESLVTGAAHLRSKESDRIAASVAAARVVGCAAEERDDGFRIRGPARTRGPVASRGDHRIAMAFAACGFDVDDLACAAKSWPGFAHALASLVS
ncbi:MAG: 3-phosphoshikimate 1-carboxyvinyltransferase [Planctomycetes bacterium]|nr:3-phosphoshikimate 1-carboxyvinyltransferase [Planctomycetota bacterium]